MPPDRGIMLAAFVCFALAVPPLGIRVNLTALGLALMTFALWLR
jgi:hypothetical protein